MAFLTGLYSWRLFAKNSHNGDRVEKKKTSGKLVPGRTSGAYYGIFLGLLSCVLFVSVQTPFSIVPAILGFCYCARSIFRGISIFRSVVGSAVVGLIINSIALLLIYCWLFDMFPFVFEPLFT